MEGTVEWRMNKRMMAATQRSCYSVRMMMRRMRATTAQTAPRMIIFYREGNTEETQRQNSVNEGEHEN